MGFAECFKNNMDELGLPAPDSIFRTAAATTATISALAAVVAKYGTEVTIQEFLGATFIGTTAPAIAIGIGEVALVVGGMTASFYLGACIGSLLGCSFATFFADRAVVKSSGIPFEHACRLLAHRQIPIPSNMRSLLLDNPEMRGAKPSPSYEARVADLAYSGRPGRLIA